MSALVASLRAAAVTNPALQLVADFLASRPLACLTPGDVENAASLIVAAGVGMHVLAAAEQADVQTRRMAS